MTRISRILFLAGFLFFFGKGTAHAQLGIGHEIGVVAGPVAFFGDYGVRYSLETNASNTGNGIGIVHYMNFGYRENCNYSSTGSNYNDHFKIRTELVYHETELRHFGYAASRPNVNGEKLRAMIGNSQVFEIGAHLEYFPLSIRDYTAFAYPFAPFLSLGANFVTFTPSAYSTLGPLEDNLFPTFVDGLKLESGSTWSIVAGGGVRYKLGLSSDLVANAQWRYYHTDWLDGLNHDQPQNKAKDMIFWLNVGYIYYLNF